jgi:hypothetical protein
MSAKREGDVAALRQALVDRFAADLVETELFVPYDQQAQRARIFEACQVLDEKYVEEGVIFHVKAPRGFALA